MTRESGKESSSKVRYNMLMDQETYLGLKRMAQERGLSIVDLMHFSIDVIFDIDEGRVPYMQERDSKPEKVRLSWMRRRRRK